LSSAYILYNDERETKLFLTRLTTFIRSIMGPLRSVGTVTTDLAP